MRIKPIKGRFDPTVTAAAQLIHEHTGDPKISWAQLPQSTQGGYYNLAVELHHFYRVKRPTLSQMLRRKR